MGQDKKVFLIDSSLILVMVLMYNNDNKEKSEPLINGLMGASTLFDYRSHE